MFGRFGRVDGGAVAEVGVVNFADGNVHINAIEERAGKFFLIVVDLGHSAGAFVGGVAEVAAGARIHGSNKHKIGGVSGLGIDARDGNFFVF